jgi:uncharacterized protein YecT (DUF1311 family)
MLSITALPLLLSAAALPCNPDAPSPSMIKPRLASADRELNATWSTVRSALDPVAFKTLRDEQRLWIGYRDMLAKGITGYPLNEPADHCGDYLAEQTAATISRTEFLKAWIDPAPVPWSGYYVDSFGGSLQITASKAGLQFSLGVARGYAFNNGEIRGVMQPIGSTAIYRQPLGDDGEAVVRFSRQNQRLNVDAENAESLAGHNAYFDGRYVRLRELTAQERLDVLRPPDR